MVFVPEGQPDSSQARSAWIAMQRRLRPGGTVEGVQSKLRAVQSSRWDKAIFLMTPGTSCLATIMRSLRDKTIRPAEALIELALTGLKPWAESHTLLRGKKHPKHPLSSRHSGQSQRY